MGYDLHVQREARLARVSLFGEASVEEQKRWLDDLVSHPDWVPGFDVLVDARELANPDLPYQHMREIAQHAKRLNERLGAARHAIVGDTDLLFGCCRMGEQLCWPCSREIVVFRDMEAAERWLDVGETEPSRHSGARFRKAQGQPEADQVSGGRKR
jgi:hypothetical protein